MRWCRRRRVRTTTTTSTAEPRRYVYTDSDGVGVQDPAIRAYGSRFLGMQCERVGAWWRGKAHVRFSDGTDVIVRARLLRRIR